MFRWLIEGFPVEQWRGLRPPRTSAPARRVSRLIASAALAFILLVGSAAAATNLFQSVDGTRWLEQTWRALWVAALALQAITTLWMVLIVRPPHTRDLLRTTPNGVALWLRGEWWHVLRRARVLLLYIVLLRMGMIGLLLLEVTAIRGRYLDLIAAFNMAEPLPVPLLLVLLAVGMTTALLLPLFALGADAALGLMFAYTLRERTFALTYQLGWLLVRWGSMAAALWLYDRVANGEILTSGEAWLPLYAAAALVGDHGATFTSLTRMAQAWATIPHAAWVALLGALLLIGYSGLIALSLWAARRRQDHRD